MFGLFKSKASKAAAKVSTLPPPLPASAERVLRRLEWTVIRRLDGLLQGDYRTLLRGAGLDLADLREYQLHDDVRHIDWNVTARLQQPHVRVFTEDREMAAWFLLDLSPSVDFGSTDQRKRTVSAKQVVETVSVTGFCVQVSLPVAVKVVTTEQALAGTMMARVKLADAPGASAATVNTVVLAVG